MDLQGVAATFDVLGVAIRDNERNEALLASRATAASQSVTMATADADADADAVDGPSRADAAKLDELKEKLRRETANSKELEMKRSSQREVGRAQPPHPSKRQSASGSHASRA